MPALIGVNEFVSETKDDINSPTTSSFVSRMAHCRQMVSTLEEEMMARIGCVCRVVTVVDTRGH
ncbi:unnamed protein product [Oppiella nova]|uniref:Uncharacterized protein n=1 Tax=Oppiella nova TaxID=334625 RepID=A0A7R9LZB6_9ACAR|nr:unnamed protein product [Oppiella nova]CAG2168466.1 unnamed protein product [Oppiella nova]